MTMMKAALFLLGALAFFVLVLIVITPTHPQQGQVVGTAS
jgi:hypothetical protein